MAKPGLFDVVNHINEKTDIEFDPSDYNPWMMNAALSNHMQTVLYASEMNRLYDLPKEAQYLFMYHGIPKGKRFGKWHKKEKDELIDIVCEVFSINKKRANEVLRLVDRSQLEWIKTLQGGHYGKQQTGRSDRAKES